MNGTIPLPADEISLDQLIDVLRSGMKTILPTMIVFGSLAFWASFAITPLYRANVLMVVVDDAGKNGVLGGLAGQFGGLATLAGASLGSSGNRSELVATLSSRKLIENFVVDKQLLPVLFEDDWDSARGDWKSSKADKPSMWDATELFISQIRSVQEDKRTGLVELSIEWRDAKTASEWANDLARLANKSLRDQAINRSEKNLSYLHSELGKATVVEVRQAIYRLIESEFKNVMVAQGSEEYAFRVIDPAIAAEKKVKPNRLAIAVFGSALGLLISVLYILRRGFSPRRS